MNERVERATVETTPRRTSKLTKFARPLSIVAISLASGAVGSKLDVSNDSTRESSVPVVTTNKTDEQVERDQMAQELDRLKQRLETLTEIIASQAGVSVEVVNGELPGPESLPGYGRQVSPELRNTLESSVLKMGKRTKGDTGPWTEVCTANKVTYEGQDYVVTAAHCLTGDMANMAPGGKGGGNYGALDITELSEYDYAVLDPNVASKDRVYDTIAQANRVSVQMSGSDLALFSISTTPEFEAVGSLQITETTPIIAPGVGVALRSVPESSGNEPISATGTYLGRVEDAYKIGAISRTVDIVGLSGVDAENVDACMYGASGSGAMTAEGVPLLALSTRHQTSEYDNGTYEPIEDRESSYNWTLKTEEALGIDVSGFDVLCSYATVGPDDMSLLLNPTSAEFNEAVYTGEGK